MNHSQYEFNVFLGEYTPKREASVQGFRHEGDRFQQAKIGKEKGQSESMEANKNIIMKTPGSKRKSGVFLKEKHKSKSNRKSIHRNITKVQFEIEIKRKKKRVRSKQQDGNQTQEVTSNFEQSIAKMKQMQVKNSSHLEQLSKQIIEGRSLLEKLRQMTKKARNNYFKQRQLIQQSKYILHESMCEYYAGKEQVDNFQFQTKETLFRLISQQEEIVKKIHQNEYRLQEKKQIFNHLLSEFQNKAEIFTEEEMKAKQIRVKADVVEKNLRQLNKTYEIQLSQQFILKLQLNSSFYISLKVNSQRMDKSLLLNNDYKCWERNKNKGRIHQMDLKRFIILQLYRGWKNILRKISYQSSQYQVLFGEISNQCILQDLRRLLIQQNIKASSKKIQKSIIFYTEVPKTRDRRQEIIELLSNFNNGIIHIERVSFTQEHQAQYLNIQYTYFDEYKLVEKFVYQQFKEINKEKIIKDSKNGEKRFYCLIQIPLISHIKNHIRYQEVYEQVIKHKKPKQIIQRSLSK